jgi:membrane fusion protein, adhesin transport system
MAQQSPHGSVHCAAVSRVGDLCPDPAEPSRASSEGAQPSGAGWTFDPLSAAPFDATLRSLQNRRSRLDLVAILAMALLAVPWAVWMCRGSVTLYAVSRTARIEVDSTAHAISTGVGGLVVRSELQLGKRVRKGDLLLALDSTQQSLGLSEARARLRNSEDTIAVARRELESEREGRALASTSSSDTKQVAESRLGAALIAAESSAEQDYRTQRLKEMNLVSIAEASRSTAERSRQELVATEQQRAVRSVQSAAKLVLHERELRALRLERQITELAGDIVETRAAIDRLQYEMARRTVRAPVAGFVANLTPAPPGTYIAPGRPFASIVPEGDLQIVALFPQTDIGRIRPAQTAVVRLDGFPWAQFGTHRAHVQRVAAETQGAFARVELVVPDPTPGLPLAHGLTGRVEIAVEHERPVLLLLRSIGALISGQPVTEAGDTPPIGD